MASQPWYRMTVEEVCQALQVDPAQGLSEEEARRRLATYGPNRLPEEAGTPLWRMFLEQFTEAMVLLLLAAAGISWAMGDYKEAVAILVIVVLNAVLGVTQEYRAERALAALRKLAVPTVRVRREGTVREISAEEVVPGDVLLLEAGDAVPADARVLQSVELRVDESALTGESEPVSKQVEPLEMDHVPIAERRNMLFMGTWVTFGHGEAVVVATGEQTELGKIATMLRSVQREPTPLQRRLARLGRDLTFAALALIVLIFLLGLLQGQDPRYMFITAISMAVAAVPEGLPAVVTIALALGAQRMLRRNALIRKLPAVETLGSVTTICTDKTGTLTQNRMTVVVLDGFGKRCDVAQLTTRMGGRVVRITETTASLACLDDDPDFPVMLITAALCNNAQLVPPTDGEDLKALGDPTEAALVVAAARFGYPKPALETVFPRVAEVPFTSKRKRMSTVHTVNQEALPQFPRLHRLWERLFADREVPPYVVFVKGAADVLLARSNRLWKDGEVIPLSEAHRAHLLQANEDLARQGIRVLGLALKGLDTLPENGPALEQAAETDLIFLGLVGMKDPLRPEAMEAVRVCREAGIEVKMITGDHPATARAIAQELGLLEDDQDAFLTGVELERLSPEDLKARVENVRVFARVAPEHKLRIVEALQARGHITAMTGDGVNDAPALKKADIGVAMGKIGTEVAKEAADMVLLDDNFATIVAAVEEGRVIYDNVRRFIQYTLSSNIGEIFVMLVGPLLGMPVPLTPLQILWINLVTDGLPGLALTVEPPEKDTMKRPPYPPQTSILGRGLGRDVLWVGLVLGALSLLSGWLLWKEGRETWRTVLFTVLCLSQMSNAWALRSYKESIFTRGLWTNKALLGAIGLTFLLQLLVVYVPGLQTIFGTQALSLQEFLLATLFIPGVLIAFEFKKWLVRRGVLAF